MIEILIDILKALKIPFIISPYESDPQIAYLVWEGIADFAISEDSDLFVFGCPKMCAKFK